MHHTMLLIDNDYTNFTVNNIFSEYVSIMLTNIKMFCGMEDDIVSKMYGGANTVSINIDNLMIQFIPFEVLRLHLEQNYKEKFVCNLLCHYFGEYVGTNMSNKQRGPPVLLFDLLKKDNTIIDTDQLYTIFCELYYTLFAKDSGSGSDIENDEISMESNHFKKVSKLLETVTTKYNERIRREEELSKTQTEQLTEEQTRHSAALLDDDGSHIQSVIRQSANIIPQPGHFTHTRLNDANDQT